MKSSTVNGDEALLILDFQTFIVENIADAELLDRVSSAITAARMSGIPVIYTQLLFRRTQADVNPTNKTFRELIETTGEAFTHGGPLAALDASLSPAENEPVVVKKRISAFAGSDLAIVLQSLGIRRICVAGLITSGVVLSTVCDAADRDYAITVLNDGCADFDPEVHHVLINKVLTRMADISTVAEWTNRQALGV